MPVELIDMVLATAPGARPAWGRDAEHPSVLVETARGETGLRAGVQVLMEYLKRTNTVALEVVRSRTRDGALEAIYVRTGPPPADPDPLPADGEPPPTDLSPVAAQVDKMTAELSAAVTGVKS